MVDLRDLPARRVETAWGNWKHNAKNRALEFHSPNHGGAVVYWIDLDRMQTAEACLDWIFQLHKKRWMTDQDRGDLLRAIDYIVDPQAHLCCCGNARRIPPRAAARESTGPAWKEGKV